MPITPLFVPGIRFDRFEQALQSGADTIIIDLEDSVSETQKMQQGIIWLNLAERTQIFLCVSTI